MLEKLQRNYRRISLVEQLMISQFQQKTLFLWWWQC